MDFLNYLRGAAPFVAMIIVEFSDVGLATLSKAAMTKGMSSFVFNVYWNLLGAIVLLPFAVFRRKGAPLSLSLVCKFFLISLIGSAVMICAVTGIKYSSPTLSAAILNLVPIFTFLLAIMMRMEQLDLRSKTGLAISLGAVVAVLGASIATLYKGPLILTSSYPSDFHDFYPQQSDWVFGGLLLVLVAFLSSIWYIFMTLVVTEFPEKPTIVFFLSFFCAIITGVFSFFFETNPEAWNLRVDIELVSIFYAGIIGCVIRNIIHAWCLGEKGPMYTAMFKPLGIVISVVMTVLFLGESLHVGSLVGGMIVAVGFYAVMWGKAKEQSMIPNSGVEELESGSPKAPLLLNYPDGEI